MNQAVPPARSILFVSHDIGFFVSHRLAIAIAAQQRGYRVAVVGPAENGVEVLRAHAIRHIAWQIPSGLNHPFRQARTLLELADIFGRERPDLVHLIASKAVILGGAIARVRRISSVSAISGLGHVFIDDSIRSTLLRRLVLLGYRFALSGPLSYTIFQNEANQSLFVCNGISPDHSVLIRGAGTDISRFDPSPSGNVVPVVLLPARMLWTKGVGEFCEAARLLAAAGVKARFRLVGDPYPGNPASIEPNRLEALIANSPIEWIRRVSDVAEIMHKCDIVALPSYSEGFPKTLIDAAAAGRATVTTDIPGCRDAIEPGETGLLVNARDSADLALKIRHLVEDSELRRKMGQKGRQLAEKAFAIENIVDQHLELFDTIICRAAEY